MSIAKAIYDELGSGSRPRTARELAESLGLSASTVRTWLTRMVAAGAVRQVGHIGRAGAYRQGSRGAVREVDSHSGRPGIEAEVARVLDARGPSSRGEIMAALQVGPRISVVLAAMERSGVIRSEPLYRRHRGRPPKVWSLVGRS